MDNETVSKDVTKAESALRWSSEVRAIATKILVPVQGSEEAKNVQRMAEATGACEVIVSIANMFNGLIKGNQISSNTAIVDLAFGLNTNGFWLKHSSYLMPILNTSINAAIDYHVLVSNKEILWDRLEYQCRHLWLDILPQIVFLISGFAGMRKSSLELKKSMEHLV